MSFWHSIPLLMAFLPLAAPDFLREPDYAVQKDGERWLVQKPQPVGRQPLTISRHRDRGAAEFRRKSLPPLRLNGLFVRFDPATSSRTVIADWAGEEDALQIGAEVHDIVQRFAPPKARALLASTSIYMARLSGVTGHTAEESGDHKQFVIYVDPFRATGRLHLAATLVHELAHVERYRARGFHANRAAAVLPKRDFILLGFADEFSACQAEAALVRAFLDRRSDDELLAARQAMSDPELNWPVALTTMLGFEGPASESRRLAESRRHIVLDVEQNAGRYWDSQRTEVAGPELQQTIRDWYKRSREWKEMSAGRSAWKKRMLGR